MADNNQNDPLAERKLQAQRAMEDDKHRVAKEVKANQRNKRRQEAEHAMEGEDLRKRREMREKLAAHKTAEREMAAQDEQAKAEAERLAAENAEAQAASEAEEAEKVYQGRVDKIQSSKQTIEQLKGQKVMMSPLRTFKSDMARAVKEGGISLSNIAISEQTRKRLGLGPAAQEPKKSKTLLLYLLLILFVLAIGGGIFFWWRSQQITPVIVATNPTSNTQSSFVFSDTNINLDLPNTLANARNVINEEAEDTSGQWTIKNITLTQSGTILSWPRVSQLLELKVPDVLARNLSSQYMFGLYRTGSINQRFILLKTSSPDTAFASLLAWEGTMGSQLLPLFYETPPKISISGTAFQDKLIRNKDTRILTSSDKQTVLIYGLMDKETIILAPNEETFIAVFDRFTNNQ